jgi:hypothetical protein
MLEMGTSGLMSGEGKRIRDRKAKTLRPSSTLQSAFRNAAQACVQGALECLLLFLRSLTLPCIESERF